LIWVVDITSTEARPESPIQECVLIGSIGFVMPYVVHVLYYVHNKRIVAASSAVALLSRSILIVEIFS
jgi:hypothetical protein